MRKVITLLVLLAILAILGLSLGCGSNQAAIEAWEKQKQEAIAEHERQTVVRWLEYIGQIITADEELQTWRASYEVRYADSEITAETMIMRSNELANYTTSYLALIASTESIETPAACQAAKRALGNYLAGCQNLVTKELKVIETGAEIDRIQYLLATEQVKLLRKQFVDAYDELEEEWGD